MITLKQEESLIDQVKALSEIEFSSLLREMSQHLRRNHWEHMIDDCFEIETYEDELDEMTSKKNECLDRAMQAEEKLNEIRDLLS